MKNNKNKNIKVSVIIPTYNSSKYLKHALESVSNQTFKDLEIIVIDDGSTDDTKNILEEFINSRNIEYIYQENKGTHKARMHGVAVSNGKYIAFIDSDDAWIDINKLQKQVEFLDRYPSYVLLGTSGVVVDEKLNPISKYNVPLSDVLIRKNILFKNPFIQSSILVRKDALDEALSMIHDEYVEAEDYALWLYIGLSGKLYNLEERSTMYVFRKDNISSLNKKRILRNNIKIIKKFKRKYPNYTKAKILSYLKFYIYSFLTLIKNKKIQNKINTYLYKIYRKNYF